MQFRTAHYIKPLKTDGIPETHVVIDCETQVSKRHGTHAHRWKCGAIIVLRRGASGHLYSDNPIVTDSAKRLWKMVTQAANGRERLVVWAQSRLRPTGIARVEAPARAGIRT